MVHATIARSKAAVTDLAIFGGAPTFDRVRSTSNLVRPDLERFLAYSRLFFDEHRYTNDGPALRLLEERLCDFHGAKYCVAVASGFWGLVLSLRSLALPGRREVVMPSLTYRRMADAVAWAGLVPHYCEVDPGTLAVTPETMRPCIGPDTAIILAPHPIVSVCDAPALRRLAETCRLPILFDSVESAYEFPPSGRVGSFGDAELFSLHASKLLNGFEGGYVTTPDAAVARQLRAMRGFGFEVQDRIDCLGTNAKLNEVHAAMALASLDDVDAQVQRNRHRYDVYQADLAAVPGIELVEFDETCRPGYKNIVVELTSDWPLTRAHTLRALHAEGMLARPYYAPPLHAKRADYPTIAGDLTATEQLAERFMLLPSGYQVSEQDVEMICELMMFLAVHGSDLAQRLDGAVA